LCALLCNRCSAGELAERVAKDRKVNELRSKEEGFEIQRLFDSDPNKFEKALVVRTEQAIRDDIALYCIHIDNQS